MKIKYLEDLLLEAKLLHWENGDYEKAEDIKIKGSQALVKLFPMERAYAHQFATIDFTLGSYREKKYFIKGKARMVSMLEAKIDLLRLEEQENKEQNVDNGYKVIELVDELTKTRAKLALQVQLSNMATESLEALKAEDRQKSETIDLLDSQIEGYKSKLKSQLLGKALLNGIVWTIIVAAPIFTYELGKDNGVSAFYNREIALTDSIKSLNDKINRKDMTEEIKRYIEQDRGIKLGPVPDTLKGSSLPKQQSKR